MNRQYYYVSLKGFSLTKSEMGEGGFMQIRINEAEQERVEKVLKQLDQDEKESMQRAFIPYKSADHDPATETYSDDMLELYRLIYEYGTEETREHIQKSGLLDRLQNTDYWHEGYRK